MDNDGGSIRSLPSVAPQPLTSRSSARVGVAPEFSELRKTSHLQLTPHEEEEAKLRPDMEDTHARRLISQTAPRILNSKVCGGAQLKLAPQPPPPQGLCDQRLCCCLTFCTVWVLVVSVALFTLWYYYLQNTNYSLREAITALDAKLQEGLQVDTSFVQESVLTLTETNDRLVLRVTSLEDRETISEWNITSINEFAHEIQDEVKVLQAQVATLQSQVAYLLSLHSEPRLDALESGLQYANANITDIHAVDAMLTNRTTVLERRADNHEARVEVLEADDVQAHYNISRLVGRADVDEYNISVLKARADANDVFVYDIYLNLTGTANTTSVLVLRSENGLSRIAALENYTVPEVNITRAARTPSRQHANFTSHTAAVNAVVTIGTDYVIASASDDITIKVWDLRAGQLLGTLSKTVGQGGGHTQPIKALAYFPMDRLFMSGAVDSDIIAWDTSTVTDVTRMGIIVQAHFSEVLALSSSLSGSQPLLSGGDDHVVKVWYWSDGSNGVSRTITVNGAAVLVLGVSFNSNPSLGHTAAVTSLAVSPSGLVLSGGQDGSVYVWNITGRNPGTPLTWFPVAGGIVSSLVSMPSSPWSSSDSEFAVVAYLDSTLRMWSIHTGALVRVLVSPGAGGVYSLALLRDFTVLGGGQNGGVSLWEPVTGTQYLPSLQHCLPAGGGVLDMLVLSDGSLVTTGSNAVITLWFNGYVSPELASACTNC